MYTQTHKIMALVYLAVSQCSSTKPSVIARAVFLYKPDALPAAESTASKH